MATLVGKKFPNLNVDAMNEMGDTFKLNVLEEAVNNKKKVVLFWYPKDFTFVCPTELHAFQAALPEFEKTMIEAALGKTMGKKNEAAKLLGWGRNTLTRKIKDLGMS